MAGKDYTKVRSRNFALLFYADNPQHMQALELVKALYPRHIGIAHKLLDDDGNVIIEGEGKLHYHVYLLFDNPVWISSICRKLNWMQDSGEPDVQFIRPITGRLDNALVYLLHLRNPDKEQYSVNDLFGSYEIVKKVQKAVTRELTRQIDMPDAACACLDWIKAQHNQIIKVETFARWVLGTPYYRAASLWIVRESLMEHNQKIAEALHRERFLKIQETYESGKTPLVYLDNEEDILL